MRQLRPRARRDGQILACGRAKAACRAVERKNRCQFLLVKGAGDEDVADRHRLRGHRGIDRIQPGIRRLRDAGGGLERRSDGRPRRSDVAAARRGRTFDRAPSPRDEATVPRRGARRSATRRDASSRKPTPWRRRPRVRRTSVQVRRGAAPVRRRRRPALARRSRARGAGAWVVAVGTGLLQGERLRRKPSQVADDQASTGGEIVHGLQQAPRQLQRGEEFDHLRSKSPQIVAAAPSVLAVRISEKASERGVAWSSAVNWTPSPSRDVAQMRTVPARRPAPCRVRAPARVAAPRLRARSSESSARGSGSRASIAARACRSGSAAR